jgi:NAD(P)-dependent dehydrogenase (short-subunit alcohol dehydrogenase family)
MPTAVITGANRGLGLEFVRQYVADGWRVLATVRDIAKGRAAAEAGAEVHLLDVADAAAIAGFARSLDGIAIDLLLCNAGVFGEHQSLGGVDPEDFMRVMRINALGPLLLVEALRDRLAAGATVAVVSSKMGSVAETTSAGSYAYRASKAAVNSVVKTLSLDLKSQGVTVVALSPGWVRTDMGGPSAPLDPPNAVAGMRRVLATLGPADTGTFRHYDGGVVPW